jgi:hypothetical protein
MKAKAFYFIGRLKNIFPAHASMYNGAGKMFSIVPEAGDGPCEPFLL